MDFQTFKRPLRRAAKLLGELLDDDDTLPDTYEGARVDGDDGKEDAPGPRRIYLLKLEGYKEAMEYRAALSPGVLQAYALPVNNDEIQWELANLILQRELHLVKFVVMLCMNDTEDDAEAIGKRAINLWHGLEELDGLAPSTHEDDTNDGG